MSKPTHNLLTQQSLLKSNASKEEKIRAQAKLEVFKTLDLTSRKPAKISDIAYQLFESRQKTGNVPNEIKINGDIIPIDQNNYRTIFDSYNNFLGENNQKGIEGTDWALAQRLILDSGNMIAFEDDLENAQKTFDDLNQDEKYNNKIELLQKKRKNKNFFLIKRTEEEQRKIEEAIAKKEKELQEEKTKKEEDNKNNSTANTDTKNKNPNNSTIEVEDNEENQQKNTTETTSESNEILRKGLLVNRDNVADKIRELRKQKNLSPETKIEIRAGLEIELGYDMKKFAIFLSEYLKNEGKNEELKKLDTQFAERIILDHKQYLQIDNPGINEKTQEELIKEANDCINKLKDFGYDLEYINIPEGDILHHVVRNKEKEEKKNKRTATISNVESVHLEEANHRAEELARKEYEALGKLNLFDAKTRKTWERMKTFALRSLRRQQRRNKHLSSVKGNIDLTREDVVFASDRHEMESNDGTWNGTITRRLTSHHNPDIDLLCKEYLTTNMLDRDFEIKFNNILRLDPTVTAIIGNNNMDYLASNILLKLKNEKAEYIMVDEISKLLTTGTPYNATTFHTQLNTITGKYFKETKKNYPSYIQKILDNITDPIEINRIIKHQQALLNEDVKTLQMQLQLLDNTTGAYEIDNKDKEKGFWYKFGAWMDRHPYLTVGGSILAGTGILATGGLISGVAGAATATGLIATKIGMMTAAKKTSHYTKEQKGQEKRLTHGLNIEKQAMDNIKTVMNNAPWYSWRKYKAKRQFKLYQESTQKNIVDITRLTEFINRFVAIPGTLSATEQAALRSYLSNGLARVDYYKKIGHNFVASQDKTKVEIDMRNLYTAITQGAEKLGTNVATIRGSTDYASLVGDLTTDYDTSMENFKTQRRNLELKYGIGAGMLYAGTAVGLQYVLGSGIFGNYPCGGTKVVVPGTNELALHDQVKASLANAGATQENIANIENALKNAPTSASANGYNQQAWRTIVKNEMGWQDAQLNSWMHDFMKDTLWKLNEGGANEFQQQLLNAKINSLTATSPAAKTAEAFLSSPKIGLINNGEGAKVLADLQSWLSGKDIALFTAEEKMKMGYYGHMFIGNDSGVGSRLTEQLTKMNTVGGSTVFTPEEICNRHYWLDGVGMPVFANTFMERMKPNKDEIGKPIESTKDDPVPDPTIVIADKNNPSSTSPTPTYSWLTGK